MTRARPFRVLTALLRVLRRAFPASTRRRIRLLLFHWLDLRWELPSGLELQVASYGDWIIYNEVFVSGEYDDALDLALDKRSGRDAPLQVLDLGGNVGFFTLRAVDRLRQAGAGQTFRITAVEANPGCAREFRSRVFDRNRLAQQVTLVEGAVGERSGEVIFYENSLFQRHGYAGQRASYVDLSVHLAPVERIDLLKCDIEGGEQLFLERYPDLLEKVAVAVFEFHRDLCDVERCQSLLRDYGLTQSRVSRERGPYLLYTAWR